ncbi:MAG: VOC family protein [bacterium]|nr:VOC family protein [bacterium]
MADKMPAHGTFCWNELCTRDVKAAGEFYSKLIGWELKEESMTDMSYTLLKAGDKEVGGMMAMPPDVPKEVPSHWMSYITVDDVDGLIPKVTELGGKVVFGPMDIPKVGRFCVISDPTGAAVSLITLAPPE